MSECGDRLGAVRPEMDLRKKSQNTPVSRRGVLAEAQAGSWGEPPPW